MKDGWVGCKARLLLAAANESNKLRGSDGVPPRQPAITQKRSNDKDPLKDFLICSAVQ